ncbi:MAG: ribulose-phosphate 3-epimerase [Clostridia bacterium]|nr:ribulose-phosphate 3-epimerase [Clostridia bacterium]
MIKVAPSMLAANYLKLGDEIDKVIQSGADVLHYDVMDGTFVPAISFGQEILKMVAKKDIPLDVHLMIQNPEKQIESFAKAGAKYITVHAEAAGFGLKDCIDKIHACGCLAGVSVKPFTMISMIEDVLEDADMILIMTVEPGKGGQKMIPFTVEKVRQLRSILKARGLSKIIEVDGGVNLETARLVTEAGADMLVAGSAFFKAENPKAFVDELRCMPTDQE